MILFQAKGASHRKKFDLRNDQRSSSCSLHMVNCLRERHSSILTLIGAKHGEPVGHSLNGNESETFLVLSLISISIDQTLEEIVAE